MKFQGKCAFYRVVGPYICMSPMHVTDSFHYTFDRDIQF